MQTEETHSWKEKIDPAFVEIIKVYLDFIDMSHIKVNTGYLCLDDDSLNILKQKGYPSFHKKGRKGNQVFNLAIEVDFNSLLMVE